MKTLCIINHKGGTGKTTSTMNIGAALHSLGKKVLLVDLDPQANLTESLGILNPEISVYDSLSTNKPIPVIELKAGLSLVPSSLDLAGIELELASKIARETHLKKLLSSLINQFDYALIDCPPSLGLLTINGLVASNKVYIPLEAEFLAYRGINSIVGIIDSVRHHFNEDLFIEGVFITKYHPKRLLTKSIKESVETHFGTTLMKTEIRANVALAESQANGQDIFEYAPESNGALDYMKLAKEILSKGNE